MGVIKKMLNKKNLFIHTRKYFGGTKVVIKKAGCNLFGAKLPSDFKILSHTLFYVVL